MPVQDVLLQEREEGLHRGGVADLQNTAIRADAYVFGNDAGEIRSPNEVSRRWTSRVQRAQDELDELHPKVVQERPGHSTITTTMNIYSQVTPTLEKAAP